MIETTNSDKNTENVIKREPKKVYKIIIVLYHSLIISRVLQIFVLQMYIFYACLLNFLSLGERKIDPIAARCPSLFFRYLNFFVREKYRAG